MPSATENLRLTPVPANMNWTKLIEEVRGWSADVDNGTYDCPFCREGHAISFRHRGTSPRVWVVCRVCGQFEDTLARRVGSHERGWAELWREWVEVVLVAAREAGYVPKGLFYLVALHQLQIDHPELAEASEERADNVLEFAQKLWPGQLED